MPNIQETQYYNATGSGAVSDAAAFVSSAVLLGMKLHLSAANAALQTFSVTMTSPMGSVYSTKIISQEMANQSDLVVLFSPELPIRAGSSLSASFVNSGGATWGLEYIYREEVL